MLNSQQCKRPRDQNEQIRPRKRPRRHDFTAVQHRYVAIMGNNIIGFVFRCQNQEQGERIHLELVKQFQTAKKLSTIIHQLVDILSMQGTLLSSKNKWFYILKDLKPEEWTIYVGEHSLPLTLASDTLLFPCVL